MARDCPHCYVESLTPLNTDINQLPAIHPPEAYLPFQVSDQQVQESIARFAGRIPLAPADLKPQHLRQRLRRVYFPRWLVDADVQATWRGEVGFYYEVVTHEERYDDTRRNWQTKQVTETKVRWEPRMGSLQRSYHNVAAPALDEDPQIGRALGRFKINLAKPFNQGVLKEALVTLPNRSTEDAWPDAVPGFQQNGVRECREAAGGDKIREFKWRPSYSERHWTQLLLPVYSTYYLDDDDIPRPVLIHGQSGRTSGVRRSSLKRARRIALIAGILALISVILGTALATAGYLLAEPNVQTIGLLGIGLTMVLGLGSLLPIAISWSFNRGQRERRQVFQ